MKTVTYLHFNGKCREAMSFYQKCLGTELQLITVPDTKGQPSTDPDAKIMHSQLSRDGVVDLMASDGAAGGGTLQGGNNFSVSLDCDSLEQAERFFTALSKNGKVRMPLGKMPWGENLGMLTDQFGVQWMLSCK